MRIFLGYRRMFLGYRRIFLSYRRGDVGGYAGRLGDELQERYGFDVFQDVTAIGPGQDYTVAIDRALNECDAVLALIGGDWLSASTPQGSPRLLEANDFVRLELTRALTRDIQVVPVRVGGATLPTATELPDELQALAQRQDFELRNEKWHQDVKGLVRWLRRGKPDVPDGRGRRVLVLSLAAAVAVAGLFALFYSLMSHPVTSAACRVIHSAWETGGAVYSRPYVAGDGTVYVGSADRRVYAFGPTGAVCWTYNTGSPIYTSPWLLKGVLYIISSNKNVYALNARTGKLKWKQEIGSLPRSLTLDRSAGVLYIGSANGTVSALRADSGEQAWPPFPTRSQIETAPVVSGGSVYVCNDSGTLYALNTDTGVPRWKFQTSEQGYCAPAVNPVTGVVYAVSSGASTSKVYAIRPNRQQAWPRTFSIKRAVRSIPTVTVDGTLVYVASANGTIYALDTSDGHQQWVQATGHPIYQSSPTQYGITVYVGTYDGYVYSLQALNGGKSSFCHIGGKINSTPNLFNNTIYIGNGNGKVYALNQSKEC